MKGLIRQRGATHTAYWWVRDSEGQWVQRSKGGFKTPKAAQTHLNTMLANLQDGSYTESTDKKITVARFLREVWLPAVRTGSTKSGEPRRESTIASYEVAVEKWIIPHIGGERLVGLSPARVEDMVKELAAHGGKRGRPLGGRSVQYAFTVLRMALELALRRGYVQRNVAALLERPGATQREMSCWTAEEAQKFLVEAAEDRLYAAWVLFLARGPRRGELAGLRWSDVDLEQGRVRIGLHTRVSVGGRVVESEAKTRAGRRTVPLDPGLVAVLKAHRRAQLAERMKWGEAWADSGYVFTREDGQPYHPEHFSDRFDRLVKAADLPRLHLHELRHTAASLMLADGTPVKVAQEILGHSSPSITQALYQHVLPGMAEEAGARLSGRLLGAP